MKTTRLFTILVITLISGFFVLSMGWAATKSDPIQLSPTKHHPDASGSIFIGDSHVSVQARGLKPNAVYTVWFVNMKPKKHETGAGSAPYMFQTDRWGGGSYAAPLSESPFGKWSLVMVVLHPDGNPRDMKNMVGALKAKL